MLHAAIRVSDLETTAVFYEDERGLEHAWDFVRKGVRNHYVVGEDGNAEIQFVHDPDAEDPVEPDGIDHIAVSVGDVHAEFERLIAEPESEAI